MRLILQNDDIARVEADDRPVLQDGALFRHAGKTLRRLPRAGLLSHTDPRVASWLLEDGPFEYWRGPVTEFRVK